MRKTVIWIVGLLMGGCLWSPKNEPAQSGAGRDLDIFKVRLVRPGMTIAEADGIVAFANRQQSVDTLTAKANKGDCGIIVEFADGKVVESRTDVRVTCIDTPPPEDTEFLNRVHFGMTPSAVAKEIGAPIYGYENTPDTVVLLYASQPAIELTFVGDKLEKWRRTHTYSSVKKDHLPQLSR